MTNESATVDNVVTAEIEAINTRSRCIGYKLGGAWYNLSKRPMQVDADLKVGDRVEAKLDPKNDRFITAIKRSAAATSAASSAEAPAAPPPPSSNPPDAQPAEGQGAGSKPEDSKPPAPAARKEGARDNNPRGGLSDRELRVRALNAAVGSLRGEKDPGTAEILKRADAFARYIEAGDHQAAA